MLLLIQTCQFFLHLYYFVFLFVCLFVHVSDCHFFHVVKKTIGHRGIDPTGETTYKKVSAQSRSKQWRKAHVVKRKMSFKAMSVWYSDDRLSPAVVEEALCKSIFDSKMSKHVIYTGIYDIFKHKNIHSKS